MMTVQFMAHKFRLLLTMGIYKNKAEKGPGSLQLDNVTAMT